MSKLSSDIFQSNNLSILILRDKQDGQSSGAQALWTTHQKGCEFSAMKSAPKRHLYPSQNSIRQSDPCSIPLRLCSRLRNQMKSVPKPLITALPWFKHLRKLQEWHVFAASNCSHKQTECRAARVKHRNFRGTHSASVPRHNSGARDLFLWKTLRLASSPQLWPWLPVITGYFYGIIHFINGVISTYNW